MPGLSNKRTGVAGLEKGEGNSRKCRQSSSERLDGRDTRTIPYSCARWGVIGEN